jgi:hypothetical protein
MAYSARMSLLRLCVSKSAQSFGDELRKEEIIR